MDAKQKLEMEIEEIKGKLQVMKHLGDEDDAAVQKKMEDMSNELQEKVEDLNDVESMNHVLIAKERQSNDELQDARKQLITVWFLLPIYICLCLIFASSSTLGAFFPTKASDFNPQMSSYFFPSITSTRDIGRFGWIRAG